MIIKKVDHQLMCLDTAIKMLVNMQSLMTRDKVIVGCIMTADTTSEEQYAATFTNVPLDSHKDIDEEYFENGIIEDMMQNYSDVVYETDEMGIVLAIFDDSVKAATHMSRCDLGHDVTIFASRNGQEIQLMM